MLWFILILAGDDYKMPVAGTFQDVIPWKCEDCEYDTDGISYIPHEFCGNFYAVFVMRDYLLQLY